MFWEAGFPVRRRASFPGAVLHAAPKPVFAGDWTWASGCWRTFWLARHPRDAHHVHAAVASGQRTWKITGTAMHSLHPSGAVDDDRPRSRRSLADRYVERVAWAQSIYDAPRLPAICRHLPAGHRTDPALLPCPSPGSTARDHCGRLAGDHLSGPAPRYGERFALGSRLHPARVTGSQTFRKTPCASSETGPAYDLGVTRRASPCCRPVDIAIGGLWRRAAFRERQSWVTSQVQGAQPHPQRRQPAEQGERAYERRPDWRHRLVRTGARWASPHGHRVRVRPCKSRAMRALVRVPCR